MDDIDSLCKTGNIDRLREKYKNCSNNKLPTTLIVCACKYQELDIIKWLYPLKKWFIKVNDIEENNKYETLFSYSCRMGHLKVAKYIYLHFLVNIHEKEEWAFCLACSNGHLEIAKWLYSLDGININCRSWNPLTMSCHNNHIDVVEWLLELKETHTIDKSTYNKILINSCGNNLPILKLLANYRQLDIFTVSNVFIRISYYGNISVMKWLYDNYKIDIHCYDEAAFRYACYNNHIDIAKWLYSLGDVNIYIDSVFNVKNNGLAFEEACYKGHIDMVKWLYSIGEFDINDKENLAFVSACCQGHLELAKWIYSIANITKLSIYEEAFIGACADGRYDMIQWLYTLDIVNIDNLHTSDNVILYNAILSGNINMVEWVYSLDTENNWEIWNNNNIRDNIFNIVCNRGYLDILKWLFKFYYNKGGCEGINYIKLYNKLFLIACNNNDLTIAKWLYDGYIDESNNNSVKVFNSDYRNNDVNFIRACENGNLNIAKWLYSKNNLDVHVCYDTPFISACKNGHLDIAEWLYTLGADIHTKNDFAFKLSSINGHYDLLKWLYTLDPNSFNKTNLFETIFFSACENNLICLLNWIYYNMYQPLKDEISNKFIEYCFITVCTTGILKVARWIHIKFKLVENIGTINDNFCDICIKHFDTAKWLYGIGYDGNINKTKYLKIIKMALIDGNLDSAMWLTNTYLELERHLVEATELLNILFIYVCERHQLEIAKWIYEKNNDIKVDNVLIEYLLLNSDLKILKWFYSIDVRLNVKELFTLACEYNQLEIAKWLYEIDTNTIDINENNEYHFRISCSQGYQKIAEWLYSIGNININIVTDNPFILACQEGQLGTAQWLYALKTLDIKPFYNKVFQFSCSEGFLRQAKWLYSLNVDGGVKLELGWIVAALSNQLEVLKWIYNTGRVSFRIGGERYDKDCAFRIACECGFVYIIDWLKSICELYDCESYGDNYIWLISDTPYPIEYYIKRGEYNHIIKKLNIEVVDKLKLDECLICYERANTITNCNHTFCSECLFKWYNKPCAYCKQDIVYDKCKTVLLS